jgi:mRNA interferase MazF
MSSIAFTTIFSAGDIIKAPFPHVDRAVEVTRPALVISREPLGPDGLLAWALMITNAGREFWPGDVVIPNAEAHGLLIPSKVRTAKVSPIEAARASLLGRLDNETYEVVRDAIRQVIG